MKQLWSKIVFYIKKVPWYGWVSGFLLFALNTGLYNIAVAIVHSWSFKWAYCPKIDVIDNLIPFFPYYFIQIYYFTFLFWFFGPIVISVTHKENFINFFIAFLIAYFISFFINAFIPSYMDRAKEGLVLFSGGIGPKIYTLPNTFTKFLCEFTIKADNGRYNINLLPSYHCMFAGFCYLGIAKRKEISYSSRVWALTMSIIISISVVFTKQHYISDIFAGWALAIASTLIFKKINLGKKIIIKHPNFLVIKSKKSKIQTTTIK